MSSETIDFNFSIFSNNKISIMSKITECIGFVILSLYRLRQTYLLKYLFKFFSLKFLVSWWHQLYEHVTNIDLRSNIFLNTTDFIKKLFECYDIVDELNQNVLENLFLIFWQKGDYNKNSIAKFIPIFFKSKCVFSAIVSKSTNCKNIKRNVIHVYVIYVIWFFIFFIINNINALHK